MLFMLRSLKASNGAFPILLEVCHPFNNEWESVGIRIYYPKVFKSFSLQTDERQNSRVVDSFESMWVNTLLHVSSLKFIRTQMFKTTCVVLTFIALPSVTMLHVKKGEIPHRRLKSRNWMFYE